MVCFFGKRVTVGVRTRDRQTLAAYLANLATVSAALYWLYLDSYVAQAAGVAPYALVTYFGSKWFAFDRKRASAMRAPRGLQ